MIKKVLIAEDHESANISVQKALEELGIASPDYVYYCDDALLRIEKALQSGGSYDLLITDLYFEKDHREQRLPDGKSLIEAARHAQQDIRILIFSAENKYTVIKDLLTQLNIDGYVRKARGDYKELIKAIQTIDGGQQYFPNNLNNEKLYKRAHDFSQYDITVLSLLAGGMKQQEVSDYLKANCIQPSGLSSIEKRLSHIKKALDFSTKEQLVAYCVKVGIV